MAPVQTVSVIPSLHLEQVVSDDKDASGDSDFEDDASDVLVEIAPQVDAGLPTPRRPHAKIRRISCGTSDEHLAYHLREKNMEADSRAKLVHALKRNRFTQVLDGKSLAKIIEDMEFFIFEPGDHVMSQGQPGRYFFVIHDGKFEESVNGQLVNTLSQGNSFGGIALLYNTGRSATVKAITCGSVWGVTGSTFREVIHEHARVHYAENRKVLDQMNIFDGLNAKKKLRVSNLALFQEIYEPGVVVKRRGVTPIAIYFVKCGKLVVKNGKGEEIQTLQAGDSFGWRAIMYGELEDVDIVVSEKVELVGVGIGQLEKVLGGDMVNCLKRSFNISVLQKIVFFSSLPPSWMIAIASSVKAQLFPGKTKIEGDFILYIVIDGEICYRTPDGEVITLKRGQVVEDAKLRELQVEFGGKSDHALKSCNCELVAGVVGCRLGVVQEPVLIESFRQHGYCVPEKDTALSYLHKVLLVRKVPIFRELSDFQIDGLVNALELKVHKQNSVVCEQGSFGDAFYIIGSGSVQVAVDCDFVRELGPGASFGERALLFNEPRGAMVKVGAGNDARLWSIDRQSFSEAVTENMRENLIRSIELKDTNVTIKDVKHMRFIGAGSFGVVRLVEHKRTGLRYALKRIKKKDGKVPNEVMQECALMAENHHPFLLQYVDTFETESSVYILTELVTGGDLCEQVMKKMGALPRKTAQFYIASLILTLETLHNRGIVFRDLKPENVMLDQQGYVKLVDFGLAKRLEESDPRTYTLAGTAIYMAPEVVQGTGYGTECDVWSLGVLLYELVTSSLPFGDDAEDMNDIFRDILEKKVEFPPRYNDSCGKKLISALLDKDNEKRLGAGTTGWANVKDNKFFRQGVSGNLFSKITGREMDAPIVPDSEQFSNVEDATASDTEELGRDEPTDIGCRLLVTFKKFDLNGDGRIDRYELGSVLKALDSATFSEEATDELFSHIDRGNKGSLLYDDFVAWVMNDDNCSSAHTALRATTKLDCRN